MKNAIQTKQYCLYARKSTEAEERQAMSIDSQLKEMQNIAERDKLIVREIKTEAHSAKNSGERAIFNSMLEDIMLGKYNAILTWAPDRLSRNAGDLGRLVDLMDSQLLKEIKTYNQVFTESPNDKFLLMILGSQAKLENDNRGLNVKRGLRTRVEMGLWPCLAPLGYLNSNRKDQAGHLSVDQDRAPIIRQMFEKVAYEKWSGHDVFHWLKEIGFTSRSGKPIVFSRIYDILRLTFYYGHFEYPKGGGVWYKGRHKPIISKKLFNLAQRQLSLHSYARKMHIKSFAFLRLMKCGDCGSGITADEKLKKYKNGNIGRFVYYVCTKGRDRKCKALSINEKDLVIQLGRIIDKVDLDQIGMRERLEWEINRWYGFYSFATGNPAPERPAEQKELDLRLYAKCIFANGTLEEKREILRHLKSHLIIKDKKVYLDTELNPVQKQDIINET